mmetsp:Transcript_20422/g.45289  ORF Transcript_20422/g.45289 Transcript_20422/m.45289 type:complete len:332 (-) Transcript_20422:53-1048(-)
MILFLYEIASFFVTRFGFPPSALAASALTYSPSIALSRFRAKYTSSTVLPGFIIMQSRRHVLPLARDVYVPVSSLHCVGGDPPDLTSVSTNPLPGSEPSFVAKSDARERLVGPHVGHGEHEHGPPQGHGRLQAVEDPSLRTRGDRRRPAAPHEARPREVHLRVGRHADPDVGAVQRQRRPDVLDVPRRRGQVRLVQGQGHGETRPEEGAHQPVKVGLAPPLQLVAGPLPALFLGEEPLDRREHVLGERLVLLVPAEHPDEFRSTPPHDGFPLVQQVVINPLDELVSNPLEIIDWVAQLLPIVPVAYLVPLCVADPARVQDVHQHVRVGQVV